MSDAIKTCETCATSKPLADFIGRQRSCRDCAGKARRAKAAEKPGAAERKVKKPPIEYTPELGRAVCDLIAEGETLTDICLTPGMPARRDVARWLSEVDDFHLAYNIALSVRGDARVDAVARNTRDMRNGALDVGIGKEVNANLRWLAGKDNPRYADKVTVDQTIRPGAPEPESVDVTRTWIARIVAGTPPGSNVIRLVPAPDAEPDREREEA